jgi:POT family proton-dependent oligopeptide transporter
MIAASRFATSGATHPSAMTTATDAPAAFLGHPGSNFLGHPKGLYVCFFTELWERFSFYGMKALLFFYVTKYHLFPDAEGYLLLGTYAGLAYALPVIGGLLADRYLGIRKAVVFGGLLLCAGHFGMAFEGTQAARVGEVVTRDAFAIQVFYASLALIIMGVGFLKPNISTIVGRLYAAGDARRDSGFTLFYMGINIGAFTSALLCGWLGEAFGWAYGFGAAGVGMLVGLGVFLWGQPHLHGAAEPPNPPNLREKVLGLPREWAIYAGALAGVAVVQQVLQAKLTLLKTFELTATEAVAFGMTAVLFFWFVRFTLKDCTAEERARMWVLMALTAVSVLFWGLYEQSYGTWNAFADRVMNRTGLGVEWSAAQLTALGGFFIFVLSPIFAWLWPRLDARGLNPSAAAKFGGGLVFAGLAMGCLVLAAKFPEANGKAALGWFVLAYFVLEVGEMILSPIGLSAVTQLSVPRVVSLMMGVWFLASAFGEMLAGRFGTLAAIPEGATVTTAEALTQFAELFTLLMWIGLVSGALMLAVTPLLNRAVRAR